MHTSLWKNGRNAHHEVHSPPRSDSVDSDQCADSPVLSAPSRWTSSNLYAGGSASGLAELSSGRWSSPVPTDITDQASGSPAGFRSVRNSMSGTPLKMSFGIGPSALTSALADPAGSEGSEDPACFYAGVLARLPALLCFTAPTPNSFQRMQPGTWSGAFHCWGYGSRPARCRTRALSVVVYGRNARVVPTERAECVRFFVSSSLIRRQTGSRQPRDTFVL
eukprot:397314-Prorocentrum_minimum.AAC.1